MKRKLAVIVTLAAVAILWLSTGGLVILNYQTYGGRSSIQSMMRFPAGPSLRVQVDTHIQQTGIPFLLLYCHHKRPYSIRLSAYADQMVYRKLLIDEASIGYDDGEIVRLVSAEDRWEKEFQDYVFFNSTSHGVVRNQGHKVEHLFEGAVSKSANFQLRIKARYVGVDGSVIATGLDEDFEVSRTFEILTFWIWGSRC